MLLLKAYHLLMENCDKKIFQALALSADVLNHIHTKTTSRLNVSIILRRLKKVIGVLALAVLHSFFYYNDEQSKTLQYNSTIFFSYADLTAETFLCLGYFF